MAESKSIYDSIQQDLKKNTGGGGWENFFSLREEGQTCRVRFLKDFEEAVAIKFHTKWEGRENIYDYPCFNQYDVDEECPQCDDEEGRTETRYYWPVYNYENKKVEIFGYAVKKSTPIKAISELFKENGTIVEFDIVIKRDAVGIKTEYSASPVVKTAGTKFKKSGVKPYSRKKILKMVFDANTKYGTDIDTDDDYDDEDVEVKKRPVKSKGKAKTKKSRDYDDDEDDDDFDYDEPDDVDDFEDDEEEEERPKKKKKSKSSSKKKKKVVYEDDEDDDEPPFDEDDDDDDEDEELPPPRKRKKSRK